MLASFIDACINERLTFCARILIKLPRVHEVRHNSLIIFSLALDWYLFIVGKMSRGSLAANINQCILFYGRSQD